MRQWIDQSGERTQRVLFATTLDDAIPPEHLVRQFVWLLEQLDFSALKRDYAPGHGRPGIHPRVLVSVILWGLMTGIRASRKLEEALLQRIDFLWLAGGLSIDHSTLCGFRQSRRRELKIFFQQLVLLGQRLGLVSFEQLAMDGSRVRANNRRRGTRTPAELLAQPAPAADASPVAETSATQPPGAESGPTNSTTAPSVEAATSAQSLQQLSELFDAFADAAAAEDAAPEPLRVQLLSVSHQQTPAELQAAVAEVQRLTAAGAPLPARLPITDPDSRVLPNKEGGFAPNYTPLAVVDVASGLVVEADVCTDSTEERQLLPGLAAVEATFGAAARPKAVLADGSFPTGYNLEQLEAAGIECYAPTDRIDPACHPAARADLSQPVSAAQLTQLPVRTKPNAAKLPADQREQFTGGAFVYDAAQDVYYCPQGNELHYRNTSPQQHPGQPPTLRRKYQSQREDCAACPLKPRCLQAGSTSRSVSRDQYEAVRERHARRMARPESQTVYAQRRHASETPFAYIKQHLGCRQFLLRGLERVQQEWRWLVCAFNVRRLLSLCRVRAGPTPD